MLGCAYDDGSTQAATSTSTASDITTAAPSTITTIAPTFCDEALDLYRSAQSDGAQVTPSDLIPFAEGELLDNLALMVTDFGNTADILRSAFAAFLSSDIFLYALETYYSLLDFSYAFAYDFAYSYADFYNMADADEFADDIAGIFAYDYIVSFEDPNGFAGDFADFISTLDDDESDIFFAHAFAYGYAAGWNAADWKALGDGGAAVIEAESARDSAIGEAEAVRERVKERVQDALSVCGIPDEAVEDIVDHKDL